MTTQAFKPNNSLCYWNFLPNYSYVKLLMYRQHEKPLIKDLPSSSFHLSLHGTCRLHHSLKLAWTLQNFSEPPSGPTKKCVLFSDWPHLFNIRWQKHDDNDINSLKLLVINLCESYYFPPKVKERYLWNKALTCASFDDDDDDDDDKHYFSVRSSSWPCKTY